MQILKQPLQGKPLGVWIVLVLLMLALVRQFIFPLVVFFVNPLEWSLFEQSIAGSFAIAHLFSATPLAAMALFGILRRRTWGRIVAYATFPLLPLFPLLVVIFLFVVLGTIEILPIIGTFVSLFIAVLGAYGLTVNRTWFDDKIE